MKILFGLLLFVSICFPSNCKIEDGWLGIRVFETSRGDVEKLLGKPTEDDMGLVRFETHDALYVFYFADEACSKPGTLLGGFNVKKDTVLEYSVTPKEELRLDELSWSRELYNRIEDKRQVNIVSYYNNRDGIHFATNKRDNGNYETVRTIYFQRNKEQLFKFSCNSEKNK